jgi:hypothetical protein
MRHLTQYLGAARAASSPVRVAGAFAPLPTAGLTACAGCLGCCGAFAPTRSRRTVSLLTPSVVAICRLLAFGCSALREYHRGTAIIPSKSAGPLGCGPAEVRIGVCHVANHDNPIRHRLRHRRRRARRQLLAPAPRNSRLFLIATPGKPRHTQRKVFGIADTRRRTTKSCVCRRCSPVNFSAASLGAHWVRAVTGAADRTHKMQNPPKRRAAYTG